MVIYDFARGYMHRQKRTTEIEVVTIHSLQGNESTVESIDEWYQSRIKAGFASCSNYGVAYDGKIGLYVPEDRRAATSSSSQNDNRALTIEVATLAGQDKPRYKMYDAAKSALVDLLVEICRRHNKTGLQMLTEDTKWAKPADGFLGVTLHRWFADTDCPGNDILEKLPKIIETVNERLQPLYRVQLGAYRDKNNAKKKLKNVQEAGFTNAFIATVYV